MAGTGVQKFDYDRLQREARASHKKIQLDSYFGKWRMSDATKTTGLERAIGLAIIPIVGLWALILLLITMGMGLATAILKVAGAIFRRTPDN
jgi:hypothetical protein